MFDPKGWKLTARLGRFDSYGKPIGELHTQLQWYLRPAMLDLTKAETELQTAKAA